MTKRYLFLFLFSFVSLTVFSQSSEAIIGQWFNEEKSAKIEIYNSHEKYYGKIVWLSEPIDPETGKPKLDKNNPNIKFKSKPLLNLLIVSGFHFSEGEWVDGTIYDPKNGKTYNCIIKLAGKDKIAVRGFIGKSWMGLGRTTTWSRVKL
jgi:uncharacterized protein (DUF2147 family)